MKPTASIEFAALYQEKIKKNKTGQKRTPG
jgi:hypothetical protein